MNLVPFSKIATRNNRRDSHREVEKNLPIFRRRRIRWWEEGWREGTVRVGLTRFKRPPPTYPRYCSGTCDHGSERYACVGAGSFIYRGSVLAGCNLQMLGPAGFIGAPLPSHYNPLPSVIFPLALHPSSLPTSPQAQLAQLVSSGSLHFPPSNRPALGINSARDYRQLTYTRLKYVIKEEEKAGRLQRP